MKLNSGLPFSLIRYGLPYAYPKLQSNISTDVVIVGGGISGALTAFYLCEAGIDCVVIDKRTIGLGSTCASTSLLQYEIDVSLNDLIELRGEEVAVRSYLLCNEALSKISRICTQIGFKGYVPTDSLFYGAARKDERRLMEECEKRASIGLAVTYLDSKKIESLFTFRAYGGILSSNAAYADAYSLTHGLLQHCVSQGMKVFDRTVITKVIEKKDGVHLTTAENIKVSGKNVIYATGYETIEKIKKKLVSLRSTYATVTESISHSNLPPLNNTLFWNTADPYLYMRCTPDQRILIGGRDERSVHPRTRDLLIPKKTKQLASDFKKLFPSIEFTAEFSWAGTFATTRDGLPFIGRYPGTKNSFYALGFGGNGIIFSLIAAEIIRDFITGRTNEDADLFRFDRL